jgi:hypothetical protein
VNCHPENSLGSLPDEPVSQEPSQWSRKPAVHQTKRTGRPQGSHLTRTPASVGEHRLSVGTAPHQAKQANHFPGIHSLAASGEFGIAIDLRCDCSASSQLHWPGFFPEFFDRI